MPKREFRINKMDYVNKTFRLPASLVEELGKNSTDYNELTDDGIKRKQTLSLKDTIKIVKQGGVGKET